jgi:hypothetical protein
MLNKMILKNSTVLLVLILSAGLAWGGQKKSSPPPPPPPKPAAPAPAPNRPPTGQPSHAQPGVAGPGTTPGGGGGKPPVVGGGGGGKPPVVGGGGGGKPPVGGGGGGTLNAVSSRPTPGGGHVDIGANGHPLAYRGIDGKEAKFGSNGKVSEIRDPKTGTTIQHGLRPGDTKIVTEKSNHTRLVSMGPHGGYSERAYLPRNGHTYYQRTYWDHGHSYARVYRDHFYGGVHYYHYVPAYYYHPAFYGWAYNSWGPRVYYNWGWGAEPWFYGGYFAPAPFYPSASLWLTDYLLSEDLKQAYEAKQEAQARAEANKSSDQPPEGGAPAQAQLTPDQIKQVVEAEVQRQLADEQAAAQSPQRGSPAGAVEAAPAALDPNQRLFVVSSNLGVKTVGGQECELTPGDIINRIEDNPTDSKVKVSVMSSKQNDCSVGAMPMVAVDDLQEMHNSFHAQLDSGLQTLASKAGTNGLPKAPDTQTQAGEVPPASPDHNVDAQLVDQQKEAAQTEAEVRQEVPATNY